MSSPFQLQVAVTRQGLRMAAESMRHWLVAEEIVGHVAYGAELVLEELGSNLLRHVDPQGAVTSLQIEAIYRQGRLDLVLVDDGPPFDPTRAVAPDLTLPPQVRQVGGLGLLLVRRVSFSWTYVRTADGNRVECNFITVNPAISPS